MKPPSTRSSDLETKWICSYRGMLNKQTRTHTHAHTHTLPRRSAPTPNAATFRKILCQNKRIKTLTSAFTLSESGRENDITNKWVYVLYVTILIKRHQVPRKIGLAFAFAITFSPCQLARSKVLHQWCFFHICQCTLVHKRRMYKSSHFTVLTLKLVLYRKR